MHQELFKKGFDHVEQQKIRQQTLLAAQKQRRENLQDENRQLANISENQKRKTSSSKGRNRRRNPLFKDIYGVNLSLQISEWMRQSPEDIADWLLVPCPRGQRCMVVACNEFTEVYNKSGRRFMTLRTQLPGDGTERKSMTVIDCIYSHSEKTFYVLDGLSFGNQDLIECEAQFRFFWLLSKFDEYDALAERSERNEIPFQLLKTYDFENATRVGMALQIYPHWCENKPELDGFLFYHKEASYTCGTTPLVCWLFPFMVRDVLGLSVSAGYTPPADYISPQQYMDVFDKRITLKKEYWKNKGKFQKMDAECIGETAAKTAAAAAAAEEQMQIEDSDDESLRKLLDAERRLELGEMDNDDDWVELPDATEVEEKEIK